MCEYPYTYSPWQPSHAHLHHNHGLEFTPENPKTISIKSLIITIPFIFFAEEMSAQKWETGKKQNSEDLKTHRQKWPDVEYIIGASSPLIFS